MESSRPTTVRAVDALVCVNAWLLHGALTHHHLCCSQDEGESSSWLLPCPPCLLWLPQPAFGSCCGRLCPYLSQDPRGVCNSPRLWWFSQDSLSQTRAFRLPGDHHLSTRSMPIRSHHCSLDECPETNTGSSFSQAGMTPVELPLRKGLLIPISVSDS